VLSDDLHSNMIPVPLEVVGSVTLHVVFYPGCEVSITGKTVRLELLGEAQYIEEFHP